MAEYVIDSARSSIHIRTFAEGLMARLAHDLVLVATSVAGTSDGAAKAHLEIPVAGLAVAGVLGKDGAIDTRTLSASDHRAILEKMRADVFRGDGLVVVDADREVARLTFPNGRTVETPWRAEREEGQRVVGELSLSLEAIGSNVVRGPMNAFRVKDRVVVAFDLVFVPPSV